MRIRELTQLTLLLATACSAAVVDSKAPNNVEINGKVGRDDILAMNERIEAGIAARQPATTASPFPTQPAKPYRGTDDAPFDGLDGKPHAGPFVDRIADDSAVKKGTKTADKAVPTMLERLKAEIADIPEKNDGVMDDASRPAPLPGTTGTEGGVSEKAKTKSKQGLLVENKPTEPKAQPPLPHSEQERIREVEEKTGVKLVKDNEPEQKAEIAGAMGIEKPDDLPDKPHDIPHPDGSNTGSNGRLIDTMPYTEGEKPKGSRYKAPPKEAMKGAETTDDNHAFEEWFHSFVVSLTMIIFTEIGDKTFLVAALMAMRHDRLVVFSAAFSALIAMTVLSAVLGHLAPTLLPKRLTTLAAAILFIIFGLRMLREGMAMSKHAGVGEEMEEVEAELEEKEHDMARRKDGLLEAGRAADAPRSKKGGLSGLTNLLGLVLSPAWVQTFIMTFLGEWGDRSQIATIAMAAGQDYWWVTLGAILGHAFCTGLAVIGGRALAGRVSMRVVTIGGAIAFLVFGVLYLVECYLEA